MLKKIFYFGVGLASIIFENFDELARTGEEKYNQFVRVNHPEEEPIEIETEVSIKTVEEQDEDASDLAKPDDLTVITGIGPTFARRLQEAGIKTYADLAKSNEEQIRDITGVAEWQADPHDWIVAAAALS